MSNTRITILSVLCLLVLPLVVVAGNLLSNPDFEERDGRGVFSGWMYQLERGTYAGPSRSKQAIEGRRCLELCCPEPRQSGAVVQRCKVVPGREYLFGGLFLGRSGYARVNCYDKEGRFIGCAVQRDLTGEPETYTWSALSSTFVPGEGTDYVEVVFDMWAHVCKGSGYADHLFLGEKPEGDRAVPGTPELIGRFKDGRVLLEWKPCEHAAEYILYRAYFSDQGKGEAVALVKGTSWMDTAIDPRATRCIYRVQALDEARRPGELSTPAEVSVRNYPDESATRVGVFSAFQKIRRYEFLPDSLRQNIELDLARNETAAFQVVLCNPGRTLEKIGVSVDDLRINGAPVDASQCPIQLFRVEYVLVDRPSVMRKGTSSLPGWLPDPLLPWQDGLDVPRGENRSVWVKLRTSRECPVGEIRGTVVIREKGRLVASLPLKATVHDISLPVSPSYQSAFQIRYDRILEAFGFKEPTEESERVVDRYIELLLDHRLNPIWLPCDMDSERGRRFLKDPRLVSLALPTGDFGALGELHARLKKDYGIDSYVYVQDEPSPNDFQQCRDTAALVHKNKNVPYILTTAPNPKLFGVVDIWVPSLQDVDRTAIAERQRAGEHVWWYTSLVPRSPFPTYLVDDCGTSPRALAWLQALYRIEGILYWDICMHRRFGDDESYDGQVWETPRLYREGNGDGFLVYPGKQRGIDGPVTSMRLEQILEGNEELELFAIYRRLLSKAGYSTSEIDGKIAEIVEPAARSLTRWSSDSTAFDRQRKKLIAKILRLMRGDR